MKIGSSSRSLTVALSLFAAVSMPHAQTVDLHRDDGVRIVFLTDLRADFNIPGDRIFAKVEKDPGLPKDTILEGRIRRVHFATPYRAASMDMEFTALKLPSGQRFAIEAVPTPINDPHLRRGADGRLISAYKPGEEGAYVVGGTVGGLILGGIGHRPILGAFVGSIIGSIAGAQDRRENANLVVRKGERMVAIFEQDVNLNAPSLPGTSPGWRHREDAPAAIQHRPADPVPVSATTSPESVVKVGDQMLSFDGEKPYTVGTVLMVPLESVADQLNIATTVHDNGEITLDGPDTSAQLTLESTSWKSGANTQSLPHKVETRDGVTYVPIAVFARLTSTTITVNGVTVSS